MDTLPTETISYIHTYIHGLFDFQTAVLWLLRDVQTLLFGLAWTRTQHTHTRTHARSRTYRSSLKILPGRPRIGGSRCPVWRRCSSRTRSPASRSCLPPARRLNMPSSVPANARSINEEITRHISLDYIVHTIVVPGDWGSGEQKREARMSLGTCGYSARGGRRRWVVYCCTSCKLQPFMLYGRCRQDKAR